MKVISFDELNEAEKKMYEEAFKAYKNAYAPYSNFHVGAAVIDENGEIHNGCNVESADYTLTSHAEMVAIDSMVKSGAREIQTILIVIKTHHKPGMPCGLCRQKILEFSPSNTKIISINLTDDDKVGVIYVSDISELLPYSFSSEQLKD